MSLEVETTENETETQTTGETTSPEITAPKRRGRPPGSGKKQAEGETPNAVPEGGKGAAGGTRGPKARGGKKKVGSEDTAAIAQQIKGLHLVGAMVTGIPELALGDKEAEMLAGGIIAVCSQYNLEISGKTGALIQLAGAAAAVYLPRLLAVKARVQKQREAQGVVIDGSTGEVTAA